jgi:transposase, IS5 family
MRQERTTQASLFDGFAGHETGRELKAMSEWLDGHRELLDLVTKDLCRRRVTNTGRHGLPAESALRCGLLKQHRQLSYEELAFHLEDSASFRAFARLPMGWTPRKSALQKAIGAIRAETWEAINRTLLGGEGWKTAALCGWIAQSPRRSCMNPVTVACSGTPCG